MLNSKFTTIEGFSLGLFFELSWRHLCWIPFQANRRRVDGTHKQSPVTFRVVSLGVKLEVVCVCNVWACVRDLPYTLAKNWDLGSWLPAAWAAETVQKLRCHKAPCTLDATCEAKQIRSEKKPLWQQNCSHCRQQATSIRMGPGSILLRRASRVASSGAQKFRVSWESVNRAWAAESVTRTLESCAQAVQTWGVVSQRRVRPRPHGIIVVQAPPTLDATREAKQTINMPSI